MRTTDSIDPYAEVIAMKQVPEKLNHLKRQWQEQSFFDEHLWLGWMIFAFVIVAAAFLSCVLVISLSTPE